MIEIVGKFATECWLVLGQMAPYLLLGFLVAGVLSVCISPAWVERHLGRRGLGPVVAASLFGVPLPLCSCGVIPVAASIRRHGASRAATVSFLLSTPQTGVDSIAVTYAMLGPVFAVFRPVAALATGLLGGVLVLLFGEESRESETAEAEPAGCDEACCANDGSGSAVLRAIRYGFETLPRDIGGALVIGILIAGAMAAFVQEDQLSAYVGGGLLSILVMMVVGVPLYVCATASVPIAAGLIHLGASPGAALAFLIAGPATNAAAFTTIWKVLGRRTAILYLIAVAASAIGGGLFLDLLASTFSASVPALGEHAHHATEAGWIANLSAVALLSVLAVSYRPRAVGVKGKAGDGKAETGTAPGLVRIELAITGMTCSHCAGSVKRSLSATGGARSVEVDLALGRASIEGQDLDESKLLAAVRELGFSAEIAPLDATRE